MSDPIADMLTRIRNANTAKHDTVDVPSSKMKVAIADILEKEGYITKYEIVEDGNFKTIRITLKYGADKNEKIITGIKRISKPGLRAYVGKDDIPKSTWWPWISQSFPQTRESSLTRKQESFRLVEKFLRSSGSHKTLSGQRSFVTGRMGVR